ncbi:MAG: DUF1232 domain-containing protein [Oscillibacter sp.]
MDWKARAAQLKTDVPAVFLALGRKETPWTAKAWAAVTVCYALSPIDLIPDFIPVLGYLDDLLILPGLVALTVRCIPPKIFAECRAASAGLWSGGKPKKWYFALPILLIWGGILGLVLWGLLG